MVGWAVLRQLKQDHETRHIPVQVFAAANERRHALAYGAASLLTKPIDAGQLSRELDGLRHIARRDQSELLIVGGGSDEHGPLSDLIDNPRVNAVVARSAEDAVRALGSRQFDCAVVDMQPEDMSGLELLTSIHRETDVCTVPFILHNGAPQSEAERQQRQVIAADIMLREADTPARLLQECALYPHLRTNELSVCQQELLGELYENDRMLAGKLVLVVDDDERNIFALTTVLERLSLEVVSAHTGRDAIRMIDESPEISLVLIDIMMPELDGYETMHNIRAMPNALSLPIIALTAKAMKGDREKCLAAGASDYLAKPVDVDRLLSALRVWLHR
jgi:CheY-like chemotaxis protein